MARNAYAQSVFVLLTLTLGEGISPSLSVRCLTVSSILSLRAVPFRNRPKDVWNKYWTQLHDACAARSAL